MKLTKKMCMGILLDLKKTFVAVNHQILRQKLENNGIKITCFLSDREKTKGLIENTYSECVDVKCEVPQGATLGSVSFMFFMTSICTVIWGTLLY